MIIEPKIRNNICITAHPTGCAEEVRRQIAYVKSRGTAANGPKRVLVVGSSTGYGLASRIAAAFAYGAATVGVAFEKPASETKPGTAGWYNTIAFDREAAAAGLSAKSFNADAFSAETKREVIEYITSELGAVDLVVYSLASPVRTDPADGTMYRSVLKPIGKTYRAKSVDPFKAEVGESSIEPATGEEISATVKVMGGEDWRLWIEALRDAGALAPGAVTAAFTYIGPEKTRAVYRDGTIGRAKEDLERTGRELDAMLSSAVGGHAYVSVNKALVTRSSAVIPVVSLYITLLYRIMKANGTHEGCIEQMYRLFRERLYTDGEVPVDEEHRIRLDDLEMREDVQRRIDTLWDTVTGENITEFADLEGFRNEFLQLHGFAVPGVDYSKDVEP
jgi:enoyl-[acyl-carrier protein] reductase/trans-2-enoyl-CoA reductase (NAD+)